MEITAAVLRKHGGDFEINTIHLNSELSATDVLVKVVATGLCHTDLTVRDQQMPFNLPAILGHEGSGIVERVGKQVTKVKAGDHVVLAPASCGKCGYCKSGHPSYCEKWMGLNFGDGHKADGTCAHHDKSGNEVAAGFFGQSSFATYSLATEENVVKVDKDVPLELLGPLGCGFQTGSGVVLNVLRPKAGESIAIFGAGAVGLAALMAAKAVGCTTIIAIDIHDNRLELAKELGATHTINSGNLKASEVILQTILADGVHYSFDTTGRNDVINQAVASLRFMGKCILVGVPSTPNLEIDNRLFVMGRSVEFVIEGDSVPDIFIPQLIALYKQGSFPFDKLIKFYSLEDINQAISDSEKGTTIKAILKMPH